MKCRVLLADKLRTKKSAKKLKKDVDNKMS